MPDHNLDKLKIDRRPIAPVPRRRRWARYAVAAALIVIAIGAGLALTGRPTVDTTSVTSAYPYQNDTQLNATGYVVPQRKAAVASKGQGRVEWLGVLEGTRVKKDEIIARLESNDVQASLAQARAQVQVSRANLGVAQAELKDAEIALRRTSTLAPKGAVPAAQLDIDTARVNKARATLDSDQAAIASAEANAQAAQVAVDQTVIRAPFDGIVLAKHANVGDNITPFSSASDSKGAVVTIADMETLEVEADVAESNIAKIRAEQPCEIQLDALPDLRFAGRVSRIVPTVDRSKATVLVKVRFVDRDERVLPDMSAKIAFLSKPASAQDRQPVTAVQASAVVERDGRPVVFVVKDDAVHAVAVAKGARIGELVAVRGVTPGDTVVLAPGAKLKDGANVTVAKK
ncbi:MULTISPECIES: efflux RND transporter periplasmic adaptor subunit [Burkholderia cepacia complex]|uniref:Secretion protein HlyD n=1 Tax=Burkholderia orbicola (strain AU 1054) TaxID=331271 RepID=A0A0H2XU25_BURO1|nr:MULTISPECIES: efflux RND transporter periplasmic adaptor subunit [Burkholderia cepacia complex]ABK07058.1 efflux transporter, RND family, MFP subunit [Burkholderia cenocepacia HI2424]MBJ9672301.1 efflux RND transporter periplasmic adaptor subunit [Burkholderia cenocepacia]MBJ9879630.1 efflux RND transporter periplasmic adaptor subunit [Burkholderia cenocepacia]MBJ9924011.1 efflux RND transporter periplasmic adaptor subunit [Burkholderia cenocepacia]MCA8420938.1 efflux RND transporter peripl